MPGYSMTAVLCRQSIWGKRKIRAQRYFTRRLKSITAFAGHWAASHEARIQMDLQTPKLPCIDRMAIFLPSVQMVHLTLLQIT